MLTHSKSGPLKVALLTISPHNRAILEFFFAGAGRNLFRVVSITEADALVVDYDHVGARDEWEQYAKEPKPGIILSVHAVDLPNTIWIPKPLTSKALTDAVGRVNALFSSKPTSAAAKPMADMGLPKREPVVDTAVTPMPLSSGFPPPFGMGSNKASRSKLRSLVLDLPDEDEEDTPTKPVVEAVTPEPAEKVFDPAETEITMEEIARPIELSIPPEIAERRWRELCGNYDDLSNPADWHKLAFTPENYLLSNVLEALRVARQNTQTVQLHLPGGGYALLMPASNQVYCTHSTRSDEFAMLCNNPVQTGQIALHIPSSTELLSLEQQAHGNADNLLDLEAFLWVTSLLTAQGRLNRNMDVNQRIALKHWPNMTRLEQFPQIMRISALWNQRPGTLFEVAKALDVPQRYVFSFYTAASTLNLFELDQTKLKSREKEKPKESRGLFSRLLKRLLGGGAK